MFELIADDSSAVKQQPKTKLVSQNDHLKTPEGITISMKYGDLISEKVEHFVNINIVTLTYILTINHSKRDQFCDSFTFTYIFTINCSEGDQFWDWVYTFFAYTSTQVSNTRII